MKKAITIIMFAVAIILASNQNTAEAYEIYCGTFNDGSEVYLITESVSGAREGLDCTVRTVRGRSSSYIHYRFDLSHSGLWYENSHGSSGKVSLNMPTTQRIYDEARNFV